MTITFYRNNTNPNKYVAVKRYPDGHYYYCPFMYHQHVPHYPHGLLNTIGQKRFTYHRCTLSRFLFDIIYIDYTPVTLYISSKVNTFIPTRKEVTT